MKKHLKRLSIGLVLVMVFALYACGSQRQLHPAALVFAGHQRSGTGTPAANKKAGVVMPTKSPRDGMKTELTLAALTKGYTVDLQYADNKQDVQNSQLENMITMGCDVLVIASIGRCCGVLQQAKLPISP